MYFVSGINRNQALISGLVSYNISLYLKSVQINHTHVDSQQIWTARSNTVKEDMHKQIEGNTSS